MSSLKRSSTAHLALCRPAAVGGYIDTNKLFKLNVKEESQMARIGTAIMSFEKVMETSASASSVAVDIGEDYGKAKYLPIGQ